MELSPECPNHALQSSRDRAARHSAVRGTEGGCSRADGAGGLLGTEGSKNMGSRHDFPLAPPTHRG